jgi:hypothetical protein
MSFVRFTVREGDIRITVEGDLTEAQQAAEAFCTAITAWRQCPTNPTAANGPS